MNNFTRNRAKHNLTRKTFYALFKSIAIGGLFFSASPNELHAQQCGYSAGLGCSNTDYNNFGVQSNGNAATIEYDNYVGGFHSTLVREYSGAFKIWGERTANNGTAHNLSPEIINSTNYSGLTGTPLKATMGSNAHNGMQAFVLTSDNKLWVWGATGSVIATSLTSSTTKQTINLPTGVTAANVKMIFATRQSLAILTCEAAGGQVYVLTQNANVRGTDITHSATTWQTVRTSTGASGTILSDIIALRGCAGGFIALKSDGTLWTWGNNTYLGNGTNASNRVLATSMQLPTGMPPTAKIKMIGATGTLTNISYYVLYDNGWLYALGENGNKQLGIWNNFNQTNWTRPRTASASGPTMNNIQWISPNEHDHSYPAINVITQDSTLLNWGTESGSFLGRSGNGPTASTALDPGTPTSLTGFKILAVETGGHTTMVSRLCELNFGYVGHKTNGSMGDGSPVSGTGPANAQNDITFNTTAMQPCGVSATPIINVVGQPLINASNGDYCNNQAITLQPTPTGGTLSLSTNPNNIASLSGNILTINGVGTINVTYQVAVNQCGATPLSVSRTFTSTACTIFRVNGTVWNDANGNAVIDISESVTNGATSTTNGLWANLVNSNGEVVSSVPVANDGSYSLPTTQNATYSVVITNTSVGTGALVPTAVRTLPSGWAYTGNNKANAPCVVPTCINPGTISNVVVNGADVNGNDFGIKGTYTISGTVFHDANGLNGGTPAVSGNPIYGGSSPYQTQNQPQLYIAVLDGENKVIHYVPVSNNGTYSIDIPLKDGATLQLTTTLPVYGQVAPTPVLPNNWNYVGESFGSGNGSGSGVNNGTGTGNNAPATKYDGKIHVSLPEATTTVTNVNFGIQQTPTATPKSYLVDNYDFKVAFPVGFPSVSNYKTIQMNSAALIEVNTSANGSLSGSDPEDCASGSCNGNTGGVVSTFNIGTIKNNTLLYYDFGPGLGVQLLSNNQSIPNFDATKLVIYGANGQGFNGNEFGFTYAITDQADITSPFVLYEIETTEPLPLVLVSFTGEAHSSQNYLNWITTKEEHILQYNIARSQNGSSWDIIGSVPAKNQFEGQTVYEFIDTNPLMGVNLYRLKVQERDAKTTYSQIISLTQNSTSRVVTAYPNPTDDYVSLNISKIGVKDGIIIDVLNSEGKLKHTEQHVGKQKIELSLKSLPAGVFFLKITIGNETYVQKIIKK